MSGNQPQRGEIHNFFNEYRIKIEHHQNASGRWQLGLKYQSNDEDLAIEMAITKTKEYVKGMEEAGLMPVGLKPLVQEKKKDEE